MCKNKVQILEYNVISHLVIFSYMPMSNFKPRHDFQLSQLICVLWHPQSQSNKPVMEILGCLAPTKPKTMWVAWQCISMPTTHSLIVQPAMKVTFWIILPGLACLFVHWQFVLQIKSVALVLKGEDPNWWCWYVVGMQVQMYNVHLYMDKITEVTLSHDYTFVEMYTKLS